MLEMTYEERIRSAGRIHERARYLRGSFLNSVAVGEREIAHILTDYFCTSSDQAKKTFCYENLVTVLSLQRKKNLLIKILKKDYPRYWERNAEIMTELDKVQEFRNKLAHSVVDVSDEALARPIEQGIGFVDWDDGAPITERAFQDWEVKVNMVNTCLVEIKRLLPWIEKPRSPEKP